jgi:nitric oxide reductase large subunit
MTVHADYTGHSLEDPVSNILKWILLAVAVGSFALFAWATVLTYERAAPQPDRFVAPGGAPLMTAEDIIAGKAGFQKADLMDYGSLYGMGSYFGQDYTAFALVRLAKLTEAQLAQTRYGAGFDGLTADQTAAIRAEMQRELQGLDLTQREVTVPDALAKAIATVRTDMAKNLRTVDLATGWTPAYSLDETEAAHTAEFIIYSALTTVASMSAYLLMAVGLVSRQLAERAVYFELILIFLGGVLGTGHHLYWAGGPSMWVPLGSMFSFIEVLPLVLLIIEAVQQHRLIRRQEAFHYRLAYTYIIGAAFWNFVGAGVFGGGTLNAPLINYYEHGTFLTLNHAHTALFGAFGLLAIGLIYFCLRYATADRAPFGERLGIWAFWLYNAGLVLWILLNFFPIGWPQLAAVYEHGLAYARSVEFYDTTLFWQWMRLPGDVVFAAGALLMAWDFLIKARPLLPSSIGRWIPGSGPAESPAGAAE